MRVVMQIAWACLVAQRRRHTLVAAAIAAVTTVFLLLDGLSNSVNQSMADTATALATGHINVNGIFKPSPSKALPILGDYAAVSRELERIVPELDFIVQRGRGMGKLVTNHGSSVAQLTGIDIRHERALRGVVHVLHGNIDGLAGVGGLLLFKKLADELSVGVGDVVTVSTETVRGAATARDWRVVAVAQDLGLLSTGLAFTSIQSLRDVYEVRDEVTGGLQLYLKGKHKADFDNIAERVRTGLQAAGYQVVAEPGALMSKLEAANQAGWLGQRMDISTWKDELAAFEWSHNLMGALSGVLLVVLLVITGIGVMNMLWIATRERTREIGTLRAIGMQRHAVVGMFVCEAVALGVVSAAFGAVCCLMIAALINGIGIQVPIVVQVFVMRDTLSLTLSVSSLAMAVALMAAACGAAAYYPALRAGRHGPAEAMVRG